MLADLTSAVLHASTSGSSTGPTFYVGLFVVLVLTMLVFRWVGNRRNAKRTEAAVASNAVGGASTGQQPVTFLVAPAHPFTESVSALRAFVGEASPEPKITRYTKTIVVVDEHALALTDNKLGTFLTIPRADIASVSAAPAKIKPHGLPYARTFPALHIVVRRGTAEQGIVLAPMDSLYDPVPLAEVEALAAQVRARLEVAGG